MAVVKTASFTAYLTTFTKNVAVRAAEYFCQWRGRSDQVAGLGGGRRVRGGGATAPSRRIHQCSTATRLCVAFERLSACVWSSCSDQQQNSGGAVYVAGGSFTTSSTNFTSNTASVRRSHAFECLCGWASDQKQSGGASYINTGSFAASSTTFTGNTAPVRRCRAAECLCRWASSDPRAEWRKHSLRVCRHIDHDRLFVPAHWLRLSRRRM